MSQIDCIFLPGGGLLSDGSLPLWTLARLKRALELKEQTRWIVFLSGGTVHKPPPINEQGFPIFESRAAAEYLISQGVQPQQLLTEISSYDTIGNAYFSRLLFADPANLSQLLVITSEFHIQRTNTIFEWIYGLTPRSVEFQLSFESVPNQGLSPQALEARCAREMKSLKNIQLLQTEITTLLSFQTWFYNKHKAYAIQFRPDPISGDVLESY